MAKILALDYGEKRLGFAASDPMEIVAVPLRVETVSGDRQAVDVVCAVCDEAEAEKLVVGMPIRLDGTTGPAAEQVVRFIGKLRDRLAIPIETWDERMSTGLVEKALIKADVSRAKRRKVRDKLAAQVILQGYLDAHATESNIWE